METLFVSAVEPQKKNGGRLNIYVDGEYYASLGAESCALCGVRAGESMVKAALEDAIARDNERYAFDTAAKYLEYGMRTKKEVEAKLASKNIAPAAAAAAVEKLEGYGYINDSEYAAEFVQSAIRSGKSRRMTEYLLREKGVERVFIAEAMSAFTHDVEKEIAKSAAAGLKRQHKDRRHISAALARRGFDYDIIGAVLPEE